MQFSQQSLYLINFIIKTREIWNSNWELRSSIFPVWTTGKLLKLEKFKAWNWLEVWVLHDCFWVLCFIPALRFLIGNNYPDVESSGRQRLSFITDMDPDLRDQPPSNMLCYTSPGCTLFFVFMLMISSDSRIMRANLPFPPG